MSIAWSKYLRRHTLPEIKYDTVKATFADSFDKKCSIADTVVFHLTFHQLTILIPLIRPLIYKVKKWVVHMKKESCCSYILHLLVGRTCWSSHYLSAEVTCSSRLGACQPVLAPAASQFPCWPKHEGLILYFKPENTSNICTSIY